MIKRHQFWSKGDFFGKKLSKCTNVYWKSFINGWNAQKVITLDNVKSDCESWKTSIFVSFHVCEWKVKLCRYFTCKKLQNIIAKNYVKSRKSGNFQKVLKSSIRLQLTFWITEKIAIECLNPNPKIEKKIIMPMLGKINFSCHGCVFYHFWKSEKTHFCS